MKSEYVYILVGLLIIFGLIMFLSTTVINLNNCFKEGYGGPIKNIKNIPFNDCERICDTYYQGCMKDYGDLDANWCHQRFKENCVMECYYTPYHRM
jgi:hypothetical protein